MRARRKPTAGGRPSFYAALSLFLLFADTTLAAFKNDFSAYPEGARSCLAEAADQADCDGDTVQEMNACLCGNGGGFVVAAASCVGRSSSSSSASDLQGTYDMMATSCADSKTPLAVSREKFMAAAASKTATSATRKATTIVTTESGKEAMLTTSVATATGGPSSMTTKTTVSGGKTVTETVAVPVETGDRGSEGTPSPNSTAKTGIIAGACVAAVAIVSALLGFWLWYRKRKGSRPRDESHPMLPQQGKFNGGGGMGGAAVLSPAQSDWQSDSKWGTNGQWPGQQHQSQTWDSGSYNSSWGAQQYQGWGYDPSATPYSAHPQPGGVFELAAQEPVRPVEIPATPAFHGGGGGGGSGGTHSGGGQHGWVQH